MNNEQKQDFTRRISCSNKSQLIIIKYDMFFTYCDEIVSSFEMDNYKAFKDAIRNAEAVINRLIDTLDFKYKVSEELFSLYQFVKEKLAMAIIKNSINDINDIKVVMMNLYDGFKEAASKDLSEPMMKHTQQVVAGMTYGKGNLIETLQDSDNSRGFLA